MGWMLWGSLHNGDPMLTRYVPDLERRPFYRALSRWHWVPVTVLGHVLLFAGIAVGGIRLGVSWVPWGSRRFATRDDSRNNWWIALLSGGEGRHNNHHALPVSARHGMARYELDMNYFGIRLLGALGPAKKIRVQTADSSVVLHG